MRVGLAILAVCLVAAVGCGSAPNESSHPTGANNPGSIVFNGCLEPDLKACGTYALRPDGTGLRKLAFPDARGDLNFSADGRFVAWTDFDSEGNDVVSVSRADGSGRHALPLPNEAAAESPSLSPDGKRVAVSYTPTTNTIDKSYELWTVSLDGRGLRRLSSIGGVTGIAWSPDGTRITFVSRSKLEENRYGEPADMYVIGVDGSDLHRIARGASADPDSTPAWSPDGARIAFEDDKRQVRVVDADGAKVEVANRNGLAPAWSPDGKRLAFLRFIPCGSEGCSNEHAIFIADAAGGPAREIGPTVVGGQLQVSWTTAKLMPSSVTKSLNLHEVNWANVTLPGSVCGARHPIRLHDHRAVVASTRWPDVPRVTVDSGWNPVVYGDVDGDGADEAALVADCNNGGGTASGVLAYAQVIFTAGQHSPRVLGVVTPQSPRTHGAPLLQVKIRRGEIVAHETWYGPNDGTCCPSGRAMTTWTYANGVLRLGKTLVERKPGA